MSFKTQVFEELSNHERWLMELQERIEKLEKALEKLERRVCYLECCVER